MAFVLTLAYVAFSLLSPAAFPEGAASFHIPAILGLLTILASIPSLASAKFFSILDVYLALGVTVCVSLSVIVALHWLGGGFYALGPFTPVVFAFFFILINCRTLLRLKILVGVMFVVAVFVFIQGMRVYDLGQVAPYVLMEHGLPRIRGLGIIADPNDYGQLLVTLIPLLWLWWRKGNFFRNAVFTLIPAVVLTVAIYYTHSRGTLVAVAAVLLFTFKDKLGVIPAAILVGVSMVGLVALDVGGGRGMTDDDGGRISLWMTAMSAFETRPIFGIGMDHTSDYTDTHQTAHNSYILASTELGVVGAFFWYGLLVSNWYNLTRIGRSQTQSLPSTTAGSRPAENSKQTWATAMTSPLMLATTQSRLAVSGSEGLPAFSPSFHSTVTTEAAVERQYFFAPAAESARSDPDARIASAARIVRIALVGTLASSFFLSRTFSLVLYLILGMGVTLQAMYRASHPDEVTPWRFILKRTAFTTVGAIVGLYLFLRLMVILGIH